MQTLPHHGNKKKKKVCRKGRKGKMRRRCQNEKDQQQHQQNGMRGKGEKRERTNCLSREKSTHGQKKSGRDVKNNKAAARE